MTRPITSAEEGASEIPQAVINRVAEAILPGLRHYENCIGDPAEMHRADAVKFARIALEASGYPQKVTAAESSASALAERVAVLEKALGSILKPFPAVIGSAEDMLEDWTSAVERFRATARAALKGDTDV